MPPALDQGGFMLKHSLSLPQAPTAIEKGKPLKDLLADDAIECLAAHLGSVCPGFDGLGFCAQARTGLESRTLMQRGQWLAQVMYDFLPKPYSEAIAVVTASLSQVQSDSPGFGLAGFFYLPHNFFISSYGLEAEFNDGQDPFAESMAALYQLTCRFTAEFGLRPFLLAQQQRTLEQLSNWLTDPNANVRRLCSEGTRPRLPWAKRCPALIADPSPTLELLEQLKDDRSLYVRRSVANHLGDIGKDHPQQLLALCERWLQPQASPERRWLIRHALRYPAKKGDAQALSLRARAR